MWRPSSSRAETVTRPPSPASSTAGFSLLPRARRARARAPSDCRHAARRRPHVAHSLCSVRRPRPPSAAAAAARARARASANVRRTRRRGTRSCSATCPASARSCCRRGLLPRLLGALPSPGGSLRRRRRARHAARKRTGIRAHGCWRVLQGREGRGPRRTRAARWRGAGARRRGVLLPRRHAADASA
jgi:hypothetical protein